MPVPSSDLPANLVPADDLPQARPATPKQAVTPSDLPANLVPQNDLPSAPVASGGSSSNQQGALPFDDIITREAEAAGVPVSLALSIGRTESGGVRDRARARSGAGAVGVMQLMPDTAKGLGVKNIEDPTDNIRGGIRYLKQLSQKYHGDTRAIAAAYNMGPGAYDEYLAGKRALPAETAAYIDKIAPLPDDVPQAHKDAGPAVLLHTKHLVDTFARAQKAGKDPFKAIGHTPELRHAAKLEHNGQAALQWLHDHPVEGLADIVGAPQRAVGQALDEFNHNQTDMHKAFHDIWDAVINPTDKTQARTTGSVADAIEKVSGYHIPTHAEIDDAIHKHVWAPLRPSMSVLAKGGEDFGLQFISDPLSLPGGLLERGLRLGAGAARAVHGLMPVQAAANWMHLPQMAAQAERMGSMAFGVRRDLDTAGFTREGKKARIAMENAELAKRDHNLERNTHAAQDPKDAAERYVNYVAEHGRGRTAQEARQHPAHSGGHTKPATGYAGPQPDFHTDVAELADPHTSPARRQEILDQVSRTIFQNQLRDRSTQFFSQRPHLYRGSASGLQHISTEEASTIQKFLEASPLEGVRQLGKWAITWNPAPHGLKNVGTLTYLAGGLPAVARGLAAMTHPPTAAEVRELEEMGALPKYLGAKRGPVDKAQAVLEHMEIGWRYGLAKTLERKLGKPKTEEERLLRGWLINNKVGDYRNQSAFVKMFQALGGPFVAFRLGIVPARVGEALISHPERVARWTRGQMDMQHARDSHAQRVNEIEPGGPLADFAKATFDSIDYLNQTLGNVTQNVEDLDKVLHGKKGALEYASQLAGSYIPGVSTLQDVGRDILGTERPGQKVQLSDQLLDAIGQFLGMYYHAKPSPKQEAKKYKEIRKGPI